MPPKNDRSWQEYLDSLRGSDEPGEAGGREAQPEEAPGAEAEPEPKPSPGRVVVPPEGEFERTRRRRRLLLAALGVAAVVAVVGLLVPLEQFRSGGVGPEGEFATGDRSEVVAEGSGSGDVAVFFARADSLSAAIAGFRERQRDFGLNRIGCEGLARGLEQVRSAFSRLTESRAALGSALDSGAAERYRGLTEEAREVERAFEEAGCSVSP